MNMRKNNNIDEDIMDVLPVSSEHKTVGLPELSRIVAEKFRPHPVLSNPKVIDSVACRLFDEMRRQILAGNNILLMNFGKFTLTETKPKVTNDVNRPGVRVLTPSRSKLKFVPARKFKWQLFIDTSRLPEELPNGVTLSYRMMEHKSVREKYGLPAPVKTSSPYTKNLKCKS